MKSIEGIRMSFHRTVQKESALEDPLVAKGRELGRQLASALEAQRAKRVVPTGLPGLDVRPSCHPNTALFLEHAHVKDNHLSCMLGAQSLPGLAAEAEVIGGCC